MVRNKRTNERAGMRAKERTSARASEWAHERTNECSTDRRTDQTNELRTNERTNDERTKERCFVSHNGVLTQKTERRARGLEGGWEGVI